MYIAVPDFHFDDHLFSEVFTSWRLASQYAWHSIHLCNSFSISVRLFHRKGSQYIDYGYRRMICIILKKKKKNCFIFFQLHPNLPSHTVFDEKKIPFSQNIDLRDKWFNAMLISPDKRRWQFDCIEMRMHNAHMSSGVCNNFWINNSLAWKHINLPFQNSVKTFLGYELRKKMPINYVFLALNL